ncbi:MAG: ArsR/SmtB family transcription factor [Candidatus Heimdallarchaeaceae archaeon]
MNENNDHEILRRLDAIEQDFQRFLSMFKALNFKELNQTKDELLKHELRKKIYDLCEGKLTVNEIAAKFSETRQNVTYHLGILNSAGLVAFREVGRERYYYKTLE